MGSAAGGCISEVMMVLVKGIEMFEGGDGATAEVVGLLSPLQGKAPSPLLGLDVPALRTPHEVTSFLRRWKISLK